MVIAGYTHSDVDGLPFMIAGRSAVIVCFVASKGPVRVGKKQELTECTSYYRKLPPTHTSFIYSGLRNHVMKPTPPADSVICVVRLTLFGEIFARSYLTPLSTPTNETSTPLYAPLYHQRFDLAFPMLRVNLVPRMLKELFLLSGKMSIALMATRTSE